jgi:hypothetical protein
MNETKAAYIEAHSKSYLVGFFCTLLAGPIGLIYSNWVAGVLLALFFLITSIPTAFLALLVGWPLSIVLSFALVASHNKKVTATANLIGGAHRSEVVSDNSQIKSYAVKTCPFCAEEIKQDAKICRFCTREIPQVEGLLEVDWATKYLTSMKEAERTHLERLASLSAEERRRLCPSCRGSDPACSKCAQTETSVSIFVSAKESFKGIEKIGV